jgi:hypothetical protein
VVAIKVSTTHKPKRKDTLVQKIIVIWTCVGTTVISRMASSAALGLVRRRMMMMMLLLLLCLMPAYRKDVAIFKTFLFPVLVEWLATDCLPAKSVNSVNEKQQFLRIPHSLLLIKNVMHCILLYTLFYVIQNWIPRAFSTIIVSMKVMLVDRD